MPLFGAKIDVDDKDLAIIQTIVERVCKSIDAVASSMNQIAEAIKSKKVRVD